MTESQSRLVTDNAKFALWLAWRVTPPHLASHVEDVAQAVLVQMVRAAALYDPAAGVKFTTFVKRFAVKAAQSEAARAARRGVYVPCRFEFGGSPDPVPAVGDLTPPAEGGYDAPAPEPEPEPDAAAFWRKVRSLLDARQYELVRLRFAGGLTLDEVAARAGVCKNVARDEVRKALCVLKDAGRELAECLSA